MKMTPFKTVVLVIAGIVTLWLIWESYFTGYYRDITVRVVDAETGEPLEGAVLLAQWTTTTFAYESSSSNYKVVEAVSDKKGEIFVPGIHKPGVDDPRIVVYEKGYVAWRGDTIFPGYEERLPPFKWRDGYVFELEHFKPEYSHRDHLSFISSGYSSGVPSNGLFVRALSGKLEN